MLLRRLRAQGRLDQDADPVLLVLGQLCVVIALVLGGLAKGHGGGVTMLGVPRGDVWQGLLAGLAAIFAGVSIPLNLSAIRRRRDRRE